MRIKRGDLDTPVTFRVPAEVLEAAERLADTRETTMSDIFRRLVVAGLRAENTDQQAA
jgi:hypothetical protein